MIDSHAHLTCPQILPDVDAVIERAKKGGIEQIINICTDEASFLEGIKLKKRYPFIHNTAATTPHDVAEEGESFFPIVKEMKDHLVAIGETGLDYYYEHSEKKVQRHYLERYLELALETSLPLVFHCRDAFLDLFSICDLHTKGHKSVLHCFTGTLQEAKECLDRGWLLSFSGILTYKKSEDLRAVAKYAPLDRVLVETDTPYLAPQSKRGKVNEPLNVFETAQMLADIKGMGLEEVISATSKNTIKFFSLI